MEFRATRRSENGDVEDVTHALTGAEDYFAAWKNDVEMPDHQSVEAWQRADTEHPVETGKPGYRVAYRTLKMVPHPAVSATWPNLRIEIANGDIERGGIGFRDVIPGRRADQFVIPENGRVISRAGSVGSTYLSCPNLNFHVAGWEETVKAVSYVEVIWVSDGDERSVRNLLEDGRNAVSPLLATLEFEFGPRLLSTRLLEEVGEVFQDWHWNRRVFTGTVYAESQASFVHLDGRSAVERLQPLIEKNQALTKEERNRIRLASRWYWSAQEETDEVLAFIQWWLVIECLEMVKTTDIRPVRERLALLLGCDEVALRQPMGRLFGLRGKLVHGNDRSVTADSIELVEAIARLMFASRIGIDVSSKIRHVQQLLGLGS
ncbi:hypothetical protein ACIBTW_07130 [Micromonospora parva]|uniref:hypothetical protein n=1 Tax=Micromonospora parva TaxID=1464048 RepID=UPI0037B1C8A4